MADKDGFVKKSGVFVLRRGPHEWAIDDQWIPIWCEMSGKFNALWCDVTQEFRKLRIDVGLKKRRKRG